MTTAWTPVHFDHADAQRHLRQLPQRHDRHRQAGHPHPDHGNACDDCHVTANWTPAHFDHAGVTGTCASCHNGTTATGKPANHVATTADCDDCHTTLDVGPQRFDHADVSRHLRQLPQRLDRDRQAGQPFRHHAELRRMPQHVELDLGDLPPHRR